MVDSAHDATQRASRRRIQVAALLFVSVVINYLDRSNLSVVAPRIGDELHLTPASIGLAFSAFGWTYALFQIPASRLVDRISPRQLFAGALGLWSVGTLLTGYAGSFLMLLALRMLIGALEAPSYPINNRVVTSWFPESERAGVIGLYTSGQFVGLAFLTPVLAWLETEWGWRAVFHVTGVAGILWALVWWVFYRDPLQARGVNAAEIKLIRDGGGIVDMQMPKGSTRKGTLRDDLRVVLGRRQLWGIYLGQFGLNSTLWFFLTWFPSYLVQYRHIGLASAGLMASMPFLAAFVGVVTGGFLSDWLLRHGFSLTFSRKFPIVTGLILASSIGAADRFTDFRLVIACMTVSFFGCGFASITWSVVSSVAPTGLIGLTGGIFNFVSNCAAIIVPIVVGLLIRGEDFTLPLLYISAMALVGIFSYLFLVGEIRYRVQEAPE